MPTLKAASFEERMIQSGMKKSVGKGGEDRGENEKGNMKDYSPHFVLFLLFLTVFFSFLFFILFSRRRYSGAIPEEQKRGSAVPRENMKQSQQACGGMKGCRSQTCERRT